MQVVQVDSDVPHFRIDQPVEDGWVGTVAPIIVQGPPGDYVVVPAENVIELEIESADVTEAYDAVTIPTKTQTYAEYEAQEAQRVPVTGRSFRRWVSKWEAFDGD